MSLFQPKESFHSGNSANDETFRLPTHNCEVIFASYEKGTVVGSSINRARTRHIVISGSVKVSYANKEHDYKAGEWLEIPQHTEHQITDKKNCSMIEFWFDP